MINQLSAIGYSIIALAIIVGVGIVVLLRIGGAVASCPTGYNAGTGGWNQTAYACMNDTGSVTNTSTGGTATTTMNTLQGYLGTSSGGLASWIPVIIVLVIGIAFLGAFMTRQGGKAY